MTKFRLVAAALGIGGVKVKTLVEPLQRFHFEFFQGINNVLGTKREDEGKGETLQFCSNWEAQIVVLVCLSN